MRHPDLAPEAIEILVIVKPEDIMGDYIKHISAFVHFVIHDSIHFLFIGY